jgi:hypothetical protein
MTAIQAFEVGAVIFWMWALISLWKRRRRRHDSREWLAQDAAQFAGLQPNELVTIGRFVSPLDASNCRIRLESLGIDAVVFGEMIPGYRGSVDLRVRAEDAERALAALNATEPKPSE